MNPDLTWRKSLEDKQCLSGKGRSQLATRWLVPTLFPLDRKKDGAVLLIQFDRVNTLMIFRHYISMGSGGVALDLSHKETSNLLFQGFMSTFLYRCKDLSPCQPSSLSWKKPGRVPPVGTPSAVLKRWDHPLLHTHHLLLSGSQNTLVNMPTSRRQLSGECTQTYLSVAAFVPWNIFNNAHSAPVPSQQEVTDEDQSG